MLLLMLLTSATVWADQVPVSYIKADGTTGTATATVLTKEMIEKAYDSTNTLSVLPGGWYVVSSEINYEGKLDFTDETHLILADGAKMTISGISPENDITIYGQSNGTGTIEVQSSGIYAYGNYNITINGGVVKTNSVNGHGIRTDNGNITINGGKVTATSNERCGICAENGNITLGCIKNTDYIFSSSYSSNNISIASGQTLIDGTRTYKGQIVASDAPTNKTLARDFLGIGNGNNGNINAPFTITTPQGLQLLATFVNNGETFSGKFFLLDNNIDMSGIVFEPIGGGNDNHSFMGSFDGNGHTISGININTDNSDIGLFGRLGNGGTIKNVTLDNAQITAKSNIGGIVGKNYCGNITNCHVTSTVLIHASSNNAEYHGGIVGMNTGVEGKYGTVSYCTSSAILDGSFSNCNRYGAIAGANDSYGKLSYNFAIGATVPQTVYYGAIIGENSGALDHNYYSGCKIKIGSSSVTSSGVGCGTADGPSDITANDGAVSATIISETEDVPSDLSGKVVFSREFTDESPSTICLPFAYTPEPEASIGTFYTFTGVEKKEDNWVATMAEVNGALTANTPYIFKAASTGTVMFHGPAAASISAGTTTSGPWTFKGTYNEIKWSNPPVGIYGFSAQAVEDQAIYQGQFVKVGTYVKIRPLRAYLQYGSATTRSSLSEEELPDRIMVRLVGSGETSIGQLDLKTGEVTFDDGWYTLEGIRLTGKPAKQGIYVNKGRKYIIR